MKEKIQWYWYRMQRMSGLEILHRIREQLRFHTEEGYQPPPMSSKLYNQPLPRLSYPDLSLVDVTKIQMLREDILRLQEDNWRLLGIQRPVGSRCAWGMDPTSQQFWPMNDAPHSIENKANSTGRDIKLAWEHLKLQHLQLLAYGVFLWNDTLCKEMLLHDIQDWLSNTTPFKGIGYASGIECALRVMSILIICSWVEEDFFPLETRKQLWQRLYDLYHWLLRYPSLYSSENNHRVAELSAVFIIELLVPEWRPIPIAYRARQLEELCRKQFYNDGVNKEQALYYQALVMEWMLIVSALCEDRSFPFYVDDILQKGALFLHTMMDAGGNIPNIGDADDSVIVRSHLSAEDYVLNICCATICYLQLELSLPLHWKSGFREALLQLYKPLINENTKARSSCFPEGGYTVFRNNGVLLIMDHGQIGFPSLPGHGHADALSIWLHVNDIPILIDSGTAYYNKNTADRSWFRGTRAHNTVCIAGENQSLETGLFNWSRCAQASLEMVSLEQRFVTAWHDGYAHLGIIHKRSLSMEEATIVIRDELTGKGKTTVEISFHLTSVVMVTQRGKENRISYNGREIACLYIDGVELDCQIKNGSQIADRGVHSLRYNHVEDNPCILWSGEVQLPCSWTVHWVWVSNPKEIWNEHG